LAKRRGAQAALVVAATLAGGAGAAPDAYAAWPGDNGRIAFIVTEDDGSSEATARDAAWRVVTVRADGTRPRVIYRCNSGDEGCMLGYFQGPQWSPDGRRIALGFGGRIAVANADGSGWQVLPSLTGSDENPVWSRDGKRLAFVSRRRSPTGISLGPGDVYTVRTDGTGLRQLTSDVQAIRVAWSRRGRIAYSVSEDVNFGGGRLGRIVSIDPNGRNRRILVTGGRPGRLDWSPSGRTLLFEGEDGKHRAVRRVSSSGRGLRTVVRGASAAAWSPDGKRIVYGDGSQTVRPDGSGRRRVNVRIPAEWGIRLLQGWQSIR
jgi:Tol biopolymer transport system component